MRIFVFSTLLVLAVVAGAVGPVAAQTDANTTDAPDATDTTQIDWATSIVESEYVADEGVARITLRSERDQSITLTDAGKFSTGGEVNERTILMSPGDTATVELAVTEVNGRVGVGISTNEVLYAEVIEGGGGPSPWEQTGPVAGWLGGASVIMTMTALAAVQVKRKNPTEPEDMT